MKRAKRPPYVPGAMTLAVAFASIAMAASDEPVPRTFHYLTYDEDSGDVVTRLERTVRRLTPTTLEITLSWASEADSASGTQRYVVDADYATLEWEVDHPHEETSYTGTRHEDRLEMRGTLNGETFEKITEIDEKPFYNNPSLGLEGFVRSGEEKTRFRTLRPDNLSEYGMKAKVEAREAITVNGETIDAVRVKWGLTGLRSAFFKRKLWFRVTDGVFVKSQVADGEYTELVDESPTAR